MRDQQLPDGKRRGRVLHAAAPDSHIFVFFVPFVVTP